MQRESIQSVDTQCGAETCKTQCLESTTALREGGETAPRDAQMSNFLRIPGFECGEVRGQSVYYHTQGCNEQSKPDLSAGGFLYMLQRSMKGLESELKHFQIISVNWRPDE